MIVIFYTSIDYRWYHKTHIDLFFNNPKAQNEFTILYFSRGIKAQKKMYYLIQYFTRFKTDCNDGYCICLCFIVKNYYHDDRSISIVISNTYTNIEFIYGKKFSDWNTCKLWVSNFKAPIFFICDTRNLK